MVLAPLATTRRCLLNCSEIPTLGPRRDKKELCALGRKARPQQRRNPQLQQPLCPRHITGAPATPGHRPAVLCWSQSRCSASLEEAKQRPHRARYTAGLGKIPAADKADRPPARSAQRSFQAKEEKMIATRTQPPPLTNRAIESPSRRPTTNRLRRRAFVLSPRETMHWVNTPRSVHNQFNYFFAILLTASLLRSCDVINQYV